MGVVEGSQVSLTTVSAIGRSGSGLAQLRTPRHVGLGVVRRRQALVPERLREQLRPGAKGLMAHELHRHGAETEPEVATVCCFHTLRSAKLRLRNLLFDANTRDT